MGINYLIKCVTYNEYRQIVAVKWYRVVNGKPEGHLVRKTRDDVLNAINNGSEIWTIYKEVNKWKLGSQVEPFNLNGLTYITTKGNKTTRDNLGKLEECD